MIGVSRLPGIRGLIVGLWVILFASEVGAQEQAKEPVVVPPVRESVDVIGVTPVDATGIDRDKYPADVQRITPRDGTPFDSLIGHAAGVVPNETEGSAWQPDIQFRGFTVSPLLGSAQGLAVFQDGVRLNEPFGDVVNWDALSDQAIATIDIIPGSNAMYGLNALGGVISLRTKSGFSDPGTAVRIEGASSGRASADVAAGWQRGDRGFFVAVSHDHDDGWRDFSPSRRDSLFGSDVWAGPHATGDLRLTLADTDLTGNGAAPIQLLALQRRAVFTYPDTTRNRVALLTSSHSVTTPAGQLQLTGYGRRTVSRTDNGDQSPYEPCAANGALLCLPDSSVMVRDQARNPATISTQSPLDAVLNRTNTRQSTFGLAAQLSRAVTLHGRYQNRFIAGLSADGGEESFGSWAELADLTASRGTVSTHFIASDSVVRLTAHTKTLSGYASDIVDLAPSLSVIGSVRLNDSTVNLEDRIGTALTGRHRFTSVNPSLGATYGIAKRATLFASVGQASRTPTPVELTCANDDDPCRLPNAFVSDPSLDQVVARTIEAGVRGHAGSLSWSAAGFRTINRNDILFVSSGPVSGEGHFANVGTTRRQGLELIVSGRLGPRLEWFANDAIVAATFGNDFTVASPLNPFAVDGELPVHKGDRLPLVPRLTANAGVSWRPLAPLVLTAEGRSVSKAYYRGDEGNAAPPLPGYVVADLTARQTISPRTTLQVSLRNLLDRRYATFGSFGDAREILGPGFGDPRFISPGEPRRIDVEVTYRR